MSTVTLDVYMQIIFSFLVKIATTQPTPLHPVFLTIEDPDFLKLHRIIQLSLSLCKVYYANAIFNRKNIPFHRRIKNGPFTTEVHAGSQHIFIGNLYIVQLFHCSPTYYTNKSKKASELTPC